MPANNAFYYRHNLYTFIKFKEEIRMANETQKFLSYEGLGTYDSKVKAYIVDKADTAKTSAIEADAVVVTTDVTTEGYAKSYTFTQNGATIATVDIPKDMVVSSGKVVVNPEGQDEGTYLELTLSNATSDKVYINVGKLVDIYTAKANATQVQIVIDSATREVSATIVAGGVGSTELADGAVVTAKIGDAQVTKAKLGTDVQASIDKANSAIQSVATGKTDGTVAVDGTDVLVAGLKSAAYAETTAFDAAGVADTKVKELADGAVKTNTSDISTLKTKVANLESVTIEAISTDEINALFTKVTE